MIRRFSRASRAGRRAARAFSGGASGGGLTSEYTFFTPRARGPERSASASRRPSTTARARAARRVSTSRVRADSEARRRRVPALPERAGRKANIRPRADKSHSRALFAASDTRRVRPARHFPEPPSHARLPPHASLHTRPSPDRTPPTTSSIASQQSWPPLSARPPRLPRSPRM